MPTYKLTYFNFRGLAECSRLILAYGGIDYEDNRIDIEDWPELKSSYPMGQLPVLDVDGVRLNQSLAIALYLGRVAGIAGNNDVEDALINAAALNIIDFREKIIVAFYEKDEKLKEQKLKELKTVALPAFLKVIEKSLAANNGYLAVGKISWADLYFASFGEQFKIFFEEYFNSAIVDEYLNKILTIPSIKKWIEKRPVTDK